MDNKKEQALNSEGSTPDGAVNLATAYHEAGDAVIALKLGRKVLRVSILPNQLRLGQAELKKDRVKRAHDPIEVEILILLGGVAAELLGCTMISGRDARHLFDQAAA